MDAVTSLDLTCGFKLDVSDEKFSAIDAGGCNCSIPEIYWIICWLCLQAEGTDFVAVPDVEG